VNIQSTQKLILALFLVGSFSLGACIPSTPVSTPTPLPTQTPAPITLTDGMGQTISMPAPAQRIVSLAPANTEILFAIGAGSQVVGKDTFSDYPAEAHQVTDIGGGFTGVNVEAILAQTPDLVLGSALMPPEQVKALQDVGLKVFVLQNPKDFEGLYANIQTVAQLTGHEEQAAGLVEGLKKRVTVVQAKAVGVTKRPLVFYELDGTDPNAPWTPGPGTFIDKLIQMAGGENLGNSLQGEWVQVSIEELIARNPDIILIGDATWGGVTLEDVKARTGWADLAAIQKGSLFTFDDNLVSRPGPRLVDGLEAMARLLHPELFQ
jgi:iron complex transport system substrate-binding protein